MRTEREKTAEERAREIYPLANEDDYPENPSVNRLNNACVGAFMNGYRYAESVASRRIEKIAEESKDAMSDLFVEYRRMRKHQSTYYSIELCLLDKFIVIRKSALSLEVKGNHPDKPNGTPRG